MSLLNRRARGFPGPLLALTLILCVGCFASCLSGAEAVRRPFALAAGGAEATLEAFSVQADVPVVFPLREVRGVTTNPVHGDFAPREALQRLVAGTGLDVKQDGETGSFVVRRGRPALPPQGRASAAGPPAPATLRQSEMKTKKSRTLLGAWLAFALGVGSAAPAADTPTGTVEGRVYNAVNGDYLNNARVSREGGTEEVRTNSFGEYRLGPVPAGTVSVRVSVSGYAPKIASVAVAPGAPATLDFGLKLDSRQSGAVTDAVVLDSFVVAAQREMSGSAVAINERRAAANLKNVVAADEFGDSTEGNVGEFVKFLPGVSIDYTGADARFISVRGLPNFGTAVMIDGNRMASAAAGFSRGTEFDQVSLNNMARIEVSKSPLPDTPADTVGGSVNMVLKSAFENARPVFNYRANLNANFSTAAGVNYVSLRKTAGPGRDATIKVKPGFDFTYINPVSKTFGYTLTAMTSNQFTPESFAASQWRPTSVTSTLTTSDKPFLGNFTVREAPKDFYRWSVGATFDWRLGARDVISVAGQWNYFDTTVVNPDVQFDPTGSRNAVPAAFGPTAMESAAGAARVSQTYTYQHKVGTGHNLRLSHRHRGPSWNAESGAAYSRSDSQFRGTDDGVLRAITARLPGLTLNYDGIVNSIPEKISTRSAANVPVDFRQLANYTLENATTSPSKQLNVTSSAYVNASRSFGGTVALRVKTGIDVRREDRDFRNPTDTWTFVGPDRVAATADDRIGLYDLALTDEVNVKTPYGLGWVEKPSAEKTYNLLLAHPEYFQKNEVSSLSSAATQSRKLTETVGAAFLRGDLGLLQNRLKLAGGVRYERTMDDGYGLLNDLAATYQRNASGQIIRDAAGRPVKIVGDAVTLAKLQYQDRGAHASRDYGDLYPSFNAIYQLTERLMLRTSYARTITRPQLTNIVPSSTASDPATTGIPTITVNNTALKPWSAASYDLALEYYFDQPGIVSVGVFRKDIRDFFGSVRQPATPELLTEYGFDQSYLNYDIVRLNNVGSARVSGVEVEYRQALTMLPSWARGLSVFANGTALHLEGASTADFSGFIRRTSNWGVSLSRPRYTLKLNWNYRGRQRLGAVTGVNVPAGSYQFRSPRLSLDVSAELRVTKGIAVFANLRNLTDAPWATEVYGPATPAYARGTGWNRFGAQGIFGVKGSF
jgi:iron complex outermembrane receptor protein